MTLSERLNGLAKPDHDALLSSIWKDFAGTDAHDLISLQVASLTAAAIQTLTNPNSTADQRSFAGGLLSGARYLEQQISSGIAFDASKAEYDEPAKDGFPDLDEAPREDPVYSILPKE